MSVKEQNLDLYSFKPSVDYLKGNLIKLRLQGDIDDIQTKSRNIDKNTNVYVFNEKIDFAHDEDLEIVVDIIDETKNEVLGSLPLNTEIQCISQEQRVFSLNVVDSKENVIGTFNIGAKFSQEGEENDTDQLSLTNDERYLLEKAFRNLSSDSEVIKGGIIADSLNDLELKDENIIQKILKNIDFAGNPEINFELFISLVGKALKEQDCELDVKAAHSFLSNDGNYVTVEDMVKYGNTIKLNLSESDWKNLVMKIDSTDSGKVNQEDFTQAVLGEENIQ